MRYGYSDDRHYTARKKVPKEYRIKKPIPARAAFAVRKQTLVHELATLLDVSIEEIDRVTFNMTIEAVLVLQTMVGKRIVSERNRSRENAS